mgnify:CR=1 FL=1|jgi:tubulin epsilon
MPRECVTVQIGQCGNQIGSRFWDMVLSEHANHGAAQQGLFDESMSTFFRHVDGPGWDANEIPVGDGRRPIASLRARAVLVDMEEGVVNEVAKGPLGELFDQRQYVTDVSGSGNNWAHGHEVYGPQYRDAIMESVRQTVEYCDSMQSFFLMHSLGGGTGSGLGTYILRMLEDEYPTTYRFTTAVFPSEDDDVITSPYNSVLAINELVQHASCVLPIENQALMDICSRIATPGGASSRQRECNDFWSTRLSGSRVSSNFGSSANRRPGSSLADMPNITRSRKKGDPSTRGGGAGGARSAVPEERPFDAMNNIAAHVLTGLTSSMRFPGSLNVDLNEITTNLVPYPRLHFLMPSLSPLFGPSDVRRGPRNLDAMFSDAFSRKTQLIRVDPHHSTYLACALLLRGNVQVSDVNRNIERLRSKLKTIHWNRDGFKVGICSTQSARKLPVELLCLANNCAIAKTFGGIRDSFERIFKRKAHVHHYTQYMEEGQFHAARETLLDVIAQYEALEHAKPPTGGNRLIPVI